MSTKVCARCKDEKEIIEYYKHSLSKDGLNPTCKRCLKVMRDTHKTPTRTEGVIKVVTPVEFLKIKTRENIHVLSLATCVATVLLCAFFIFKLGTQVASLEEDRSTFQSQISTLFLTMDDRERLLSLDRNLMKIPAVRQHMQKDVPALTKKLIDIQAKYYGLGIRTSHILAIIEVESGFIPTATSKSSSSKPIAYGLMQLIPTTAKSLLISMNLSWSPDLMYNPIINVELGSQFLSIVHSSMVERGYEGLDDFNISYAIYFMGERAVMSHYLSEGTLSPLARDYVVKVNMARKRWIALGS